MTPTLSLEDLFTLEDLVAHYPRILSIATLRWQLRHRATNGMGSACVQVGKKLLISKSRYEAWLAIQAEAAA